MDVLVVMHVEHEGPGLFARFLEQGGARVRTARLYLGERLPEPGAQDAVIVLGGPMNVYEEAEHPFLAAETAFLREAAGRDVPVLGVCLGAQLIARAADAPVTRHWREEIGWSTVTLTVEGAGDRLLRFLAAELPVFQWHGDTFAVPKGGTLLATGRDCRNQAFRRRRSWALQFHLEADRGMIATWFRGSPGLPEMLRRFDELERELADHARTLLNAFLEVARGRPG